jgi:hypothetical protein
LTLDVPLPEDAKVWAEDDAWRLIGVCAITEAELEAEWTDDDEEAPAPAPEPAEPKSKPGKKAGTKAAGKRWCERYDNETPLTWYTEEEKAALRAKFAEFRAKYGDDVAPFIIVDEVPCFCWDENFTYVHYTTVKRHPISMDMEFIPEKEAWDRCPNAAS